MKKTGIDIITKDWIRNASDERAARNGCRFDPDRAQWAINWIQKYCRLYEGEYAGQPLVLKDWALEAVSRIFGWVKYSEDWKREIRRFRRGGAWVPKKNKKSPTLAAIGLYLLCGDGEQGQKVFSCARDGKQAMISHQHALEMVRRSPELNDECTINMSTGRITHEPSRSFYSVVAGDNINSQEGLNGSILVDETHVVDRRLMKVLEYAGISRAEPLQIEFSTAGNNPDGYGREQFVRGLEIESGKKEDEQFFFLAHYADQDVSDEELDKNLMEIGRKANPAWGHTIKADEFRSSYNAAKVSPAKLADFKMYRLNIWQKTASPFIKATDWAACRQEFTEADMAGMPCVAGLDLSKTRDMTALALLFPMGEEEYRILPYFWMPEQVAHERAHLAPYLDWAKAGLLELTPGGTIEYGHVVSTFRRLSELFDIAELAYDHKFAEEITQIISEGVTDKSGTVIHPGTGVPRVIVDQKVPTMGPVVEQFERCVIKHTMHHNGHAVLDWQAGHATTRQSLFGKLRMLVKPSGKDDHRTIDGLAATLTALVRAPEINVVTSYFRASAQI